MGQHARAAGIGNLEGAVRKVLLGRTRVFVFLDKKWTDEPVFQIVASGPEYNVQIANPKRFRLVGSYTRSFDVEHLLEDAEATCASA